MSAMDELVQRLAESGHPFPAEAAVFATSGDPGRAQEVLGQIDAPPASQVWQGVSGLSDSERG